MYPQKQNLLYLFGLLLFSHATALYGQEKLTGITMKGYALLSGSLHHFLKTLSEYVSFAD